MFRSISKSLLWRGIITVAIGVVSVVWPHITVGAFVILFAVYAFTAAAADAVRAFTNDHAGPVVGYLLLGLLSLAAGVTALVCPRHHCPGADPVRAWAFVTGLVEVGLAFRRDSRRASAACGS